MRRARSAGLTIYEMRSNSPANCRLRPGLMNRTALARFLSDYGMLFVLLLLCAWYSLATIEEQQPTGATAGQKLADAIISRFGRSARVLVVTRDSQADTACADQARARLS